MTESTRAPFDDWSPDWAEGADEAAAQGVCDVEREARELALAERAAKEDRARKANDAYAEQKRANELARRTEDEVLIETETITGEDGVAREQVRRVYNDGRPDPLGVFLRDVGSNVNRIVGAIVVVVAGGTVVTVLINGPLHQLFKAGMALLGVDIA